MSTRLRRELPPALEDRECKSGDVDCIPSKVVMHYIQGIESAMCAALAKHIEISELPRILEAYLEEREKLERLS